MRPGLFFRVGPACRACGRDLTTKVDENSDQVLKNLYKGVEMTKDEFVKTLSKFGLKRLYPLKEKFDPNYHQAISRTLDNFVEENTVIQVVQAGYELNGRPIKPALVIVSFKDEKNNNTTQEENEKK